MEPPLKPDPSDCCNSGCNPCILDVYEEQLKKYQNALKSNGKKLYRNCFSQTSYSVFRLIGAQPHTRDSFLYTFEYVKPEKEVSHQSDKEDIGILIEPGQHIILKATVSDETFSRPYTPIYVEDQKSTCFTILVKIYEDGKMSMFFKELSVGNETLWRGPYGTFEKTNYFNEKHLFCVVQGTGIAPVYTIICSLIQNEECFTQIKLFYCCHSNNLFLREEICNLAQFWNFTYELFVSGDPEGFIQKYNEVVHFRKLGLDEIDKYLRTKDKVKILICSSDTFSKNIKSLVMQYNQIEENIFIF